MDIRDTFSQTIGNTPLIKLRKASELTGCTILGKAEFLNPGGSVKDRAALFIIQDAEERGTLRPGGVVVEGTAGNTGIGLALVGNSRGYRTVIVIPDTQSQEKKDMLRLCGADLREVPAVPYKNPENYVHISERLAKELAASEPNGALWANQWDNPANRDGHFRTTGPEIWEQTDGTVDGFVSAIGTGGTLSGVGLFLKERSKDIVIGLADPAGAAMYHLFKDGELRGSEGDSITEGIGQGRITGNVEGAPIDNPYLIPDEEALPVIFDLLKEEGLCLGGSSGINVAGAIRLAKDMGPGHTIVTILADYGTRYQSKLFNPAFLERERPAEPRLALVGSVRGCGLRSGVVEALGLEHRSVCRNDRYGPLAEPEVVQVLRGPHAPAGASDPEGHVRHHLAFVFPTVRDGFAAHVPKLCEEGDRPLLVRYVAEAVDGFSICDATGEVGSGNDSVRPAGLVGR